MKNDNWKKRELGALWRVNDSKEPFYSGEIVAEDGSKKKIVVFINKFKGEKSNQPDLRIYSSVEQKGVN